MALGIQELRQKTITLRKKRFLHPPSLYLVHRVFFSHRWSWIYKFAHTSAQSTLITKYILALATTQLSPTYHVSTGGDFPSHQDYFLQQGFSSVYWKLKYGSLCLECYAINNDTLFRWLFREKIHLHFPWKVIGQVLCFNSHDDKNLRAERLSTWFRLCSVTIYPT